MDIIVKDLCKGYGGQLVLDHVSFVAGSGITCIMAPSGAGKTTLLRILLGLELPDSGTITGLSGRRMSAVFQEDRLLDHLDAQGNLRFILGPAYEEQKARNLLAELGLAWERGKPVRDWSGGMRRRLALARALLLPFDVLTLDEPFTGLDRENRQRCQECIRQRADGKTVLLVTHDVADAAGLNAGIITLAS